MLIYDFCGVTFPPKESAISHWKVTSKTSTPLEYKNSISMVFDSLGHHGKV